MTHPSIEIPIQIWIPQGDFEYEINGNGPGYTRWYRAVNGRLADGRWPEWKSGSNETRYSRETFPDGRTQMLASELPLGWVGYLVKSVVHLGFLAGDRYPCFLSPTQVVYAASSPDAQAQLVRISEPRPGYALEFQLTLPPRELFGGRSTVRVVIPED